MIATFTITVSLLSYIILKIGRIVEYRVDAMCLQLNGRCVVHSRNRAVAGARPDLDREANFRRPPTISHRVDSVERNLCCKNG